MCRKAGEDGKDHSEALILLFSILNKFNIHGWSILGEREPNNPEWFYGMLAISTVCPLHDRLPSLRSVRHSDAVKPHQSLHVCKDVHNNIIFVVDNA